MIPITIPASRGTPEKTLDYDEDPTKVDGTSWLSLTYLHFIVV